jgi:hypothetical protein
MAVRLLYLITVRILSWLALLCRSKKELITEVSTAAARGRGCTDHETGERDRRPPNGAPWGGGLRAAGPRTRSRRGGRRRCAHRGSWPGQLGRGVDSNPIRGVKVHRQRRHVLVQRPGRLHHIGLGRRHAGTRVLVLVRDLHIRVLNTDGNLLRELTLDPARAYQPQARP